MDTRQNAHNNNFVYITYLSNDRDYKGVLLLHFNLKKYNHKYNLECIILEGVSTKVKSILEKSNIKTHFFCFKNILSEFNINEHYSKHLISKHYYGKYLIFRLTQYTKIVYLDTDLLIKKNIDELFDYDTSETMYMTYDLAINSGNLYFKKKQFNSGVIVLEPSIHTYTNLYTGLCNYEQNILGQEATDQTIMNYLNENGAINVKHLPFKYNYVSCLGETEKALVTDIVIVHFILQPKPWNIVDFDENVLVMNIYSNSKSFFSEWLELYFTMVKDLLEQMTSRNVFLSFDKKYLVDYSSADSEKTEIVSL
jgi:lipopolysaccharide biosynthesis glycosyltransferase